MIIFVGEVLFIFISLGLSLSLTSVSVAPKGAFGFYATSLMLLFWARLIVESLYCSRRRLALYVARAQLEDIAITLGFFYCIPFFGQFSNNALLLYCLFFSILTFGWRCSAVSLLGFCKRRRAILMGAGPEAKTLFADTNVNAGYPLVYSALIIDVATAGWPPPPPSNLFRQAVAAGADLIVMDKSQTDLMAYYSWKFPGTRFADFATVFEAYYGKRPFDPS